jgi:serine phosphatase RsbU (regulator of sigma subunit)
MSTLTQPLNQIPGYLRTLTVLISLFYNSLPTCSAQFQTKVDSLRLAMTTARHDSTKARLADDICYQFYTVSIDSSLQYAKLSGIFALQANDKKWLAQSHNSMGVCYLNKSSLMNSLDHFQQAYELYKEIGDKKGEAKILNNLGVIYSETSDYERAKEKYEISFKLNDELGHWVNASNALYNISSSYFQMKNYDLARKYADDLMAYKALHPTAISADPLYAEIFEQQGNLDSARFYLERSLRGQLISGDLYNWVSAVLSLGDIILKQGYADKAMETIAETEKYIEENGFIDLEYELLTLKARISDATGNPAVALRQYQQAMELRDSIDHMNQMNMINDMSTKYETDRMELKISEQKQLIESKQRWLTTILIVSALLVLGLVFVMLVLRKNRRLNSLLKLQNNQINIQRQKIISSINYAKRIQQSTLPKEHEFKKLFKDSFIYFKPKDIISGDFYAYQQIGRKIYVAAVDCTGHGVPGAFMSLIANAKLNKVVNEMGERDPGRILDCMHREIQIALHQEKGEEHTMDGVEMSLCAIDCDNNSIEFAGAGSSIFIVRNGKILEIKGDYTGLGGVDYIWAKKGKTLEFTTRNIQYQPGDQLYMFSDGIHDQIGGEEKKKLNKTKFKEHIIQLSGAAFDQAVGKCEQFVAEWRKSHQQTDDMMLIGIKL